MAPALKTLTQCLGRCRALFPRSFPRLLSWTKGSSLNLSQFVEDQTPLLCFAISGFSVVPSGPISHPHVKGATPDAASNRGSRSPGDCSCGRLPGPLRESVPVSTFPELFDGPDRPGQQKPD